MPVKAAYLLLSILKALKASTIAVSPLLYFFIKTSRYKAAFFRCKDMGLKPLSSDVGLSKSLLHPVPHFQAAI